jgi:flagellar hook-length control protein FliK
MTTDRTAAPARPAALAERANNRPQKQEPAPDVFAQILGTKAPADQPKRADAHKHDDAPRKDKPNDGATKPADDATKPAADQAATQAPEAPAPPVVAVEPVTAPQFIAQLASPLPTPQATAPAPAAQPVPVQPAPPIQALVQPTVTVAQTPAPAAAAVTPETQAPAPQVATDAAVPQLPATDTPAAEAQPAPVKTDDVKLPQAPQTAAPHAQPQAAQTGAPAQPNAGDTGQQPSQSQPEQTAAPTPTPSTAHVADAPKAEAPAEPQPVQAPAPAAPPQAAAAAQRAVPLYRAPHVAAAVIHLAQQHGVTHARINLKPAELGGIEVRLHSTPQGIAAHLVADSPEAAKALQHASDELRNQLEARDVNLLSLDVSTSNGDENRQAGFGADANRDGQNTAPRGYGLSDSERPAEAPAETTLVLPDGVLVDVLA